MAWHPPSVQHTLQKAAQLGSAAHTAYQVGKGIYTVGKFLAPLLL